MICGALQTLNEEAFEDVIASERPSPTGGPSTGETIALDNNMQINQQIQQSQQPLTPIQETLENERSLAYSQSGTTELLQSHTINLTTNINNNNNNNNSFNLNSNMDNKINRNANNSLNNLVAGKSNNIKLNNLSDTNLHEQNHSSNAKYRQQNVVMPLMQSIPSSTQINSALGSTSSLANNSNNSSKNHANDNQTTISITPSTPPASTIILMPSNSNIELKPFIDDTRL